MQQKINYLLHLADSNNILSCRNSEWCGHGPILEQDIAITNISLDLLGQARLFYQYAATLINKTQVPHLEAFRDVSEDSLSYLRNEREYKNLLITELPKGNWAVTVLKQYLFSQFQFLLFQQLEKNTDETIAAIATKSLKEIAYHVRWSKEWVIRLGDGTIESHEKMMKAIEEIWLYTGEMFIPADYEKALNIDLANLQQQWTEKVKTVFAEATLQMPENIFMQTGGKNGVHTEYLGYILTDMQYLQKTYANCQW